MAFALCACSGPTGKKLLRISTSLGPYSVMFQEAVAPELRRMGYDIKYVHKPELVDAALALANKEVDLNVEQNSRFTTSFNEQHGTKLINIQPIPSIEVGLYSSIHSHLDQVQPGQSVAVPDFPGNRARTLKLLEQAGWIKFNPVVSAEDVTAADVVYNPYDLKIKTIPPTALINSVKDYDWVVLPGSLAFPAGMSPDQRLLGETLAPEFLIQVTVREGDRNTGWATAVTRTYQSRSFERYLQARNTDERWVSPKSVLLDEPAEAP
ncbi:MetQ/NlpA family ABC transporter substrate-binding protein [Staphylococcus chromogenes]|nr:MetQ/NlpA family ABC transporter substrate-binding protein [Staphylococcus chromogenes]